MSKILKGYSTDAVLACAHVTMIESESGAG